MLICWPSDGWWHALQYCIVMMSSALVGGMDRWGSCWSSFHLVCTWLGTLCSVEYKMCQSYQLVLLLSLLTQWATAFSWRDSGYFSQRQKYSTTSTSAPSFQQYYDQDYYYDYGGYQRSQRSHQIGPLQVRDQICGSQHVAKTPALLCHKDTAKGKKWP